MTRSEQWHPSDITAAAQLAEDNAQKRRGRPPASGEKPAEGAAGAAPQGETQQKPVTSGVMTLDRDSQKSDMQSQHGHQVEQDVLLRLRETTERFVECYAAWHEGEDNENAVTQRLHDLRRVLARIEIELAASKTKESFHRPIPIPLHRAHKEGG